MTENQKIALLTNEGNFRTKVCAILRDAAGHGYNLRVDNTMRTLEEQRRKVALGHSKTMHSKHLPGRDGLARAADIVSFDKGWDVTPDVWLMVGRLARTKGLTWGGLWGLPRKMRQELDRFLTQTDGPFNPMEWKGKIGWDPAHVENP